MAQNEIISTAYISNAIARITNNFQSERWQHEFAAHNELHMDLKMVINATMDYNKYYLTDAEMSALTIVLNSYSAFMEERMQ